MEITIAEAIEPIIVQNPGKGSLIIPAKESGYNENQAFTSSMFSNRIKAKFIGLQKIEAKVYYPVYAAVEVSNQELYLGGKNGYDNAQRILDNICNILSQDGITARSMRLSDMEILDYKKERRLSIYWLASQEKDIFSKYTDYGINYFYYGRVYNELMYSSDMIVENCGCHGIRPVFIKESKVIDIDEDSKFPWL